MIEKINWHEALRLYFIAGTPDIKDGELLLVLDEAIKAGITCFQLREKGHHALTNANAIKHLAKECQMRCRKKGIPFIINDNVALGIKIGADAVHIGQSDKDILETIQAVKPLEIEVGLSINTLAQLKAAQSIQGLGYVGIGPVYATPSKADAQPIVGLRLLKQAAELALDLPKVAIGGINLANVTEVRATGIDGVAVISAITTSQNIEKTVWQLGGTK